MTSAPEVLQGCGVEQGFAWIRDVKTLCGEVMSAGLKEYQTTQSCL